MESSYFQPDSHNNGFSNQAVTLLPPLRRVEVDATPYIQALISADGEIALAAERLSLTPAQFVTEIAQDPDAVDKLQSAMRVFTTIKMFESLGRAKVTLDAMLPSLEPKDAARHFTTTATVIEQMTRNTQTNTEINIYDAAMRKMPPHVREALKTLANETPPEEEYYIKNMNDTDDD